ncbi:hypothetical protein GE061_014946 [Apolygus lucorum]|uniref:Uncharacterized protein n=1 Tax=Apolygus lucorum TaxID=248454 RepID=A0A8S9XLP4_APOLU|nr:hypothetical protein GE061_014946 [Apolygus lucorum]
MQGLFNKQRFITSLFSNGVLSKTDVITVCYRRQVISSRCALHHGKGITYKIQGGRGSGSGPNARFPRPSSSKFHKKSCWLKKPKSRKSCGSTCTVTKSRKGKIIFRVTRQPLPKVIPEEHTDKPSSNFKNSINKVFESKLVRARKSRNGFNDAKSPVDKLSLPDFKDTSIVSTGHKKTSKNVFVKEIQKSRSAESQYIVKHIQVVKSEKISTPEKTKKINSYSKQIGVSDKTKLSSKTSKDAPKASPNPKKLKKVRSRPLNFSSSEMLYSNADNSIKLGADKIKKSDSSFKKCEEQRESVNIGVKDVNHGNTVEEALVEENSLIQPVDENVDSTIKLFFGSNSKSDSTNIGSSFSETVNNLLKMGNDGTALDSECAGGRLDLQCIQLDKNIDIRALDTKPELGRAENNRGDVKKSDCFNQSTLFSKIVTGDTKDGLNKAPQQSPQVTSKAERSTSTSRNVQTLKRGDNVTLHKYVDLKRPIRQETVEFDTTVIEQKGRRITKIKPKHDSNLRKKESNRSLTSNKNKIHDSRGSNKAVKSPGNTKVESYVLSKPKDAALDNVLIIPEDGKQIRQFENNLKKNFQINRENDVIPQDGRKITGDYDWSNKGRSNQQVGDGGKPNFKSAGFVLPQETNTNRKSEAKTDAFNLGSEPRTNKNVNEYSGDTGRSQNDMKQQQSREDRMYGVLNPKKIEGDLMKDSRNQIERKESSQYISRPSHIKDNPIFDSSVGVNKHVFVNKNLNTNIPTDYRSNLKDKTERYEARLGKKSPKSVDNVTTKQDVMKSLTQKMSGNRMFRTEELKVERTVPDSQMAVEQVKQTSLESQNASTSNNNTIWRSLLPFYSSNSNDQQKTEDSHLLQSVFSGSLDAVKENPGVSRQGDEVAQWSRKVTKMKFHPQSGTEPVQTQSTTNSFPDQGIQPSAVPKIAATSETATAIVLKARLAQNPPESVTINPPQSPTMPNSFSQSLPSRTTNVGVKAADRLDIPANVINSGLQIGPLAKERADLIYPSNSSLAVGTQAAGHLPVINKIDSYSVNSGISHANGGYPSNIGINMPKASFPPPCNSCQNTTMMPSGSLASDGCNMPKATFPPLCNTCQNSPMMLTGNPSNSSSDGSKCVSPPPCNPCESPSSPQPDCFSCPTCKPEFPPPCPPNNPCSSPQRAENSCYDPCKPVTKSKTHTILDISNLPRPPTPICIDCVPKNKPCFPPECPQQCKETTRSCLNNAEGKDISFVSWRAFANYTYWSMKCLFTGLFENFLTLLKARILRVSEFKKKSICEKPVHPQGCVMQSSVIRPRKTNYKVSVAKSHDIVNSKLQKVQPRTTNRVRKRSHVVKSMKKSVLDERSKRAISAEQEKRRAIGVKAPPALAYSEVLNIVFSQKK